MKKFSKIALAAIAVCSLASCGSQEVEAKTFQDQLKKAGITNVTYVNPNSDFTHTEGNKEDYSDATTGGSNKPLYTAGSISSLDELVYRASLQYKTYRWSVVNETAKEADGATGSSEGAEALTKANNIEWAAKLPDAKYMTDLFPNDGKYYEIKCDKSAIGTKAFVTASSDGTPNVAVFGTGIKKEVVDGKNVYYLDASYLTAGITTTNLLNTGKGELLYYEYNYEATGSADKMGPGKRNYGCKVDFEVDFTKTSITNLDYSKTAVTEKGNAPEISTYAALATKLVLTNLKTLG